MWWIRKTWQNESEIGYTQRTWEHQRKRGYLRPARREKGWCWWVVSNDNFTERDYIENKLDTDEGRTNLRIRRQKIRTYSKVSMRPGRQLRSQEKTNWISHLGRLELYWGYKLSGLRLGIVKIEKGILWVQPKPCIYTSWVKLSSHHFIWGNKNDIYMGICRCLTLRPR